MGSEKITYYDGEVTNFFIGPNIEEVFGYSISNKVMIEASAYQIKLFGSDILSDDIGYSVGILFVF